MMITATCLIPIGRVGAHNGPPDREDQLGTEAQGSNLNLANRILLIL